MGLCGSREHRRIRVTATTDETGGRVLMMVRVRVSMQPRWWRQRDRAVETAQAGSAAASVHFDGTEYPPAKVSRQLQHKSGVAHTHTLRRARHLRPHKPSSQENGEGCENKVAAQGEEGFRGVSVRDWRADGAERNRSTFFMVECKQVNIFHGRVQKAAVLGVEGEFGVRRTSIRRMRKWHRAGAWSGGCGTGRCRTGTRRTRASPKLPKIATT
jgi:hypothetical protein